MIKKHPFHGDSGDLYEFVIFPIGSDFHARLPDVPGVVVFGVASGGGALTPLGFVASVHDMQKDFWDEGYMGSDEFSPPRRYMKKMALHGATHIGYCRDSNFLHLSSDTDARVIGAMMDLRNYYNTDFQVPAVLMKQPGMSRTSEIESLMGNFFEKQISCFGKPQTEGFAEWRVALGRNSNFAAGLSVAVMAMQLLRGRGLMESFITGVGTGLVIVGTPQVLAKLQQMKSQNRLPEDIARLPRGDLETLAEHIARELNKEVRS